MSNKANAAIRDWVAVSDLTAITAPTKSEVIDLLTNNWANLAVLVTIDGTVNETELELLVSILDDNDVESWLPLKILVSQTLPGGSVVFPFAVFDLFRSQKFSIVMNTTITGGGSVSVSYALTAY